MPAAIAGTVVDGYAGGVAGGAAAEGRRDRRDRWFVVALRRPLYICHEAEWVVWLLVEKPGTFGSRIGYKIPSQEMERFPGSCTYQDAAF